MVGRKVSYQYFDHLFVSLLLNNHLSIFYLILTNFLLDFHINSFNKVRTSWGSSFALIFLNPHCSRSYKLIDLPSVIYLFLDFLIYITASFLLPNNFLHTSLFGIKIKSFPSLNSKLNLFMSPPKIFDSLIVLYINSEQMIVSLLGLNIIYGFIINIVYFFLHLLIILFLLLLGTNSCLLR